MAGPETHRCCPECLYDWDECVCGPGYEDDGQPSEYDEWQDVFGGDVEEYGTYGDYDDGWDF